MRIRALIVDDEPMARRRIRSLLKTEADVEIVGECGNGSDAVRAMETRNPDLVFLDVEMPELDGFEVLQTLDRSKSPDIIFITAHDRYAVQAFDARAVDYLLKPFSRSRFLEAVERVRKRRKSAGGEETESRLRGLLDAVAAVQRRPSRIAVKSGTRVILLQTARIERVEAQGDYVRLHAGKETFLARETMNAMEAKLDPEKFARIHRSTIVNLDFVREIRALVAGDHSVLLRDGTELTLSRGYRDRLQRLLRETI